MRVASAFSCCHMLIALYSLALTIPVSSFFHHDFGETDAFPTAEVLNEPPQSSAKQPKHEVDVLEVSSGCGGDSLGMCYLPQEEQLEGGEEDEENAAIVEENKKGVMEEVDGPLKLKVDDKNGLTTDVTQSEQEVTTIETTTKKSKSGKSEMPKLCSSGVPCQKVDSKVSPSTSSSDDKAKKLRKKMLHHHRDKRRAISEAINANSDSNNCEHRVSIQAFGSNYSLCLFLKNFKDEPILEKSWPTLNVTVFGSQNASEDVAIGGLTLKYATGFVIGEEFTSVSGFLMEDHFYGTIYMRDTVHYLEPHNRKSRDMHIFGDGLKTLLHKHEVKESPTPTKGKPATPAATTKKPPTQPQRRICDLTIVADHLFYSDVGESNIEKTILQMLWHVKEANALFQSKDFDNDGQSECIGFTVSEITIFKTSESAVNLLTGEYSVPEDFLKRFSRYNFDGFCLGILFTNRAFSELVLGLSWRGNPKPDGVGGICQSRVRIKSDKNAYSFNALFISLKSSQEERIPLRMGVLNLVHEMMHSFGAKHDPEANQEPECTPKDKWVNGRYLMSKYSNDGHKLNHEILSPCTKKLVCKNLESVTRVTCLIKASNAFCGDGIVQTGEDCDCGTIFQCIAARSCCVPPEGGGDKKPCTMQRDVPGCVS